MAYNRQVTIDILGLWALNSTNGVKLHLAGKAKAIRLTTVVPGWDSEAGKKGDDIDDGNKAGAITVPDIETLEALIATLDGPIREAIEGAIEANAPEEEEEEEEVAVKSTVIRRAGATSKAKATPAKASKAKASKAKVSKAAKALTDEESLVLLANSFKLSSRKQCEAFLSNPEVKLYSPKAHALAKSGTGDFERLKAYAALVKDAVLEDAE